MNTAPLLLAALLAVGCGDSGPPKPFTGTVTIDRLLTEDGQKNRDAVRVCDEPWDAAMATIQSRLGPTFKVKDNEYSWAAGDAERCAMITFERGECPPSWNKPGPHVSMVMGPGITVKGDGARHDECVAIATAKRP